MILTAHFSLDEFTISQTAARAGIDNTIPTELLPNIKRVAGALEIVRGVLDVPVLISSGYRCPALNSLVGGVPTSAHTRGLAADFTAPAFGTPLQVARKLVEEGIVWDQLIYEFGTWVHLGLAITDDAARHEVLQIAVGTGYLPGLP
jgi:hypothetical protein